VKTVLCYIPRLVWNFPSLCLHFLSAENFRHTPPVSCSCVCMCVLSYRSLSSFFLNLFFLCLRLGFSSSLLTFSSTFNLLLSLSSELFFSFYHFYIYLHVYTLFVPPPPRLQAEPVLPSSLIFLKRKHKR
jgi:hypothetical protein